MRWVPTCAMPLTNGWCRMAEASDSCSSQSLRERSRGKGRASGPGGTVIEKVGVSGKEDKGDEGDAGDAGVEVPEEKQRGGLEKANQ